MSLDLEKCTDLFKLIESKEMRSSTTIILLQLKFANWYDLFADNTCADTIIRRQAVYAYHLKMNGLYMRSVDREMPYGYFLADIPCV